MRRRTQTTTPRLPLAWCEAIAFVLLCTASGPAQFAPAPEQAPAPPPAAPLPGPEPRFEQLPSGIRVCVIEDEALPLVSVQLWFRNGSAADPPDKPGMTHLVRTLLTHREPAATALYRSGFRHEARTLRDASVFSSTGPAAAWRLLLRVERARLEPLRPTATELADGLDRIAGEWALRAALPPDGPPDALVAALFAGHRYARQPCFPGERLAALTVDEVASFHERWFAAAQATLFVTGAVSAVEVIDEFKRTFAGLPYRDPLRTSDARPEPSAGQAVFKSNDEHADARVDIVMPTPAYGDLDRAAIDVLMHHLLPPSGGSLRKMLASAGGKQVRWRQTPWRDGGMLAVSIGVSGDVDATALLAAWDDALASAGGLAPAPPALLAARNQALAVIRRDCDGLHSRATRFAEFEILGGDLLLEPYAAGYVRRAAARDVARAAEYLANAPRCVRIPARSARDAPPLPELAPALAWKPGPAAAAAAPTAPASAWEWESPAVATEHTALHEHQLPDGTPLLTLRIPGAAQVVVRLVLETPGSHLPADAAMALGSARRPIAHVREYVDQHGIALFSDEHGATGSLCGRGPPDRAAQIVELLCEMVAAPGAVERGRPAADSSPGGAVDPAGESWLESGELPPGEAAREWLTHDQLVSGRAALLAGAPRRLIVVGEFDADRVEATAAAVLSSGLPAARPRADGATSRAAQVGGLHVDVLGGAAKRLMAATRRRGQDGGAPEACATMLLPRTLIYDPVLDSPASRLAAARRSWIERGAWRERIEWTGDSQAALALGERVAAWERGELPGEDIALAVKRANVAWLCSLDGAETISQAIADCGADPFRAAGATALHARAEAWRTFFVVSGADEATAARLRSLATVKLPREAGVDVEAQAAPRGEP